MLRRMEGELTSCQRTLRQRTARLEVQIPPIWNRGSADTPNADGQSKVVVSLENDEFIMPGGLADMPCILLGLQQRVGLPK